MKRHILLVPVISYAVLRAAFSQVTSPSRPDSAASSAIPSLPFDAIADAQTPRIAPQNRPEQKKTAHDLSKIFDPASAPPTSDAFRTQPDNGEVRGFDFSRDPFNAKAPMQSAEEIMKDDIAAKAGVMAAQQKLLEARYDLTPHLDPEAKMSRGKPLAVGPTARLRSGYDWLRLATLSPEQIKTGGLFPYP